MAEIRDVFGGVDTHGDVHVAAVVDDAGRILDTASFATDRRGYAQLLRWLRAHGMVVRVGVEGTGSWGAGLTRHLAQAGVEVVEVNRPNRQLRRRRGKSDTVDAEAAARAALNGEARAVPKARLGGVEAMRVLRVARRSAVKSRTQAMAQLRALVATGPDELRSELRDLSTVRLVAVASRFRATDTGSAHGATKVAMRHLARRAQALGDEVVELDAALDRLVRAVCPELLERFGIGTETASALLVAAGDNPERLHSEAAFAALCGVSPVEASSGKVVRHRLNRGGDRLANKALWTIVMVRMQRDERTRAYVARRTAEGRSTKEIMRCLKRYVAREVFALISSSTVLAGTDAVEGVEARAS